MTATEHYIGLDRALDEIVAAEQEIRSQARAAGRALTAQEYGQVEGLLMAYAIIDEILFGRDDEPEDVCLYEEDHEQGPISQ